MPKHKDMTPAQRREIIQGQAERLLADARALNVDVSITHYTTWGVKVNDDAPTITVQCVEERDK